MFSLTQDSLVELVLVDEALIQICNTIKNKNRYKINKYVKKEKEIKIDKNSIRLI